MKKALCWLRRDLRLHDHHALSMALKNADETQVIFVFDTLILNKLSDKHDKRVTFIMDSLKEIEKTLEKVGSSLLIRYGDPLVEIPKALEELSSEVLFFNRDYEPYAKKRDNKIVELMFAKNIQVHQFKDHVLYEKDEIRNGSGELYKVFTPYKKKWLETLHAHDDIVQDYKCPLKNFAKLDNPKSVLKHDWYKDIGFIHAPADLKGGTKESLKLLKKFQKYIHNYKEARDIPSLEQTSFLSPYLRMGNISVRDMIRASLEDQSAGHSTWLSEIVWRDFYHAILDAYPHVEKNCFRPEYDNIKWLGKKADFEKWCEGQTGYPIIDAAMRCLNATGFMHNRLRMVVASFLSKTLLIDWRQGEKYFAEKLLDYDLASNNGGWQWSASTGVDAQPYFRIFNPYSQSQKFDSEGITIRQWCPELAKFSNKSIHSPQDTDLSEQIAAECFVGKDYPYPIVNYKEQRDKALRMYKSVK